MRKLALALILALMVAALLSGCSKSGPKSASAASQSDTLEDQLRQLAGSSATNCGRTAPSTDVKNATECAMQANQAKRPFYVAYQLPAMQDEQITVALAGAADGKLYAVQYNSKGWQESSQGAQLSNDKRVMTVPCPATLRVAQSGRLTCYLPMSMDGKASPHGGMPMPPHGSMNPHENMSMPPSGTPNPHRGGEIPAKDGVPAQRSTSN